VPSIILNKLFKNLRVISTALSFIIFMIWGFLLGVTLFPILKLLIVNKTRRRKIFINHMGLTWRIFIKIMELLRAFKKIEVLGLDNFEQNRASLVIANHITLVDIVAIGSRLENFNCVVKQSLWNQPFFGSVVKACDFIPNSGSEEFIAQCERGFNDERPLVVFPEGTRKLSDEPIEFQRGVSQIAARIDVPIVPVIIECYPVTLSKGVSWYKVPDTAPHLKLTFQKPLDLPEYIKSMTPMPKKVRAINRFLEDYYKSMLK
jgi:1-acyl-sn-glycerol-3-phosphate acyltransferase